MILGDIIKKYNNIYKFIIYILIIYSSFSYSFYQISKDKVSVSNEEFINLLVSTGNANILNEYKKPKLLTKTMDYFFSVDLKNPVTILNNSILKFGKVDTMVKEISLEYNDDYSDMEELKDISEYIEDPNPTKIKEPIIYLYNSHQLENYSNENLSIYGITPNVLMASYLLREKLNALDLKTIVEEANMSEILTKNNWNYSYSYKASRSMMEEKILKYSTLEYFIDIHRDSIKHNQSTITIDDKNYAKILFVIGKDHSNWEKNNILATNLNNIIESNYNGISRGIIQKSGNNVNGIYNQDLSPNCILIEVGGVDNTIEEVNNTMEALANMLAIYIKGE